MEEIRKIIPLCDEDFYTARLPRRVKEKLFLNRTIKNQQIAVRLNLNYRFRKNGIYYFLQTIHEKSPRGRALGYDYAVVVNDATFVVDQATRSAIASGRAHKSPMAAVVGWPSKELPFTDGIEIRFNPKTGHLFSTLDNFAVKSAKIVTVFNTRVYAKEVSYWGNDAPVPLDGIISETLFG